MNFEEHFLEQDIPIAELAFKNIAGSLELINSYTNKSDFMNAQRMALSLTKSLTELDKLAYKKRAGNRMYLHHLLNQPQRWYPM
ncbi:hypothetical protein [Virgibacillus litoralis]|uniref:Uncharacterized protein n=1 Tax=Virgibacillus litoralis TaxID=578221 RepID=A0ABS4HIM6_9BACI|nr:hypothetical protein [Virgibacillus litoralis]MBP1950252.1 hypothetical protein [Virgibacillus litoralis]